MTSTDQSFARADDVVSCELEGGSALLDLNTSRYFRLNETANFIWDALKDGALSIDEIAAKLIDSYDVSKDECTPDIVDIVRELQDANLLVTNT